jgi:uncharacterized protein
MFPLGSVLFPHMPLQLRVFEERYLIMLSELVSAGGDEFGVVLIERGPEVGGGEQRFSLGATAAITEVTAHQGYVGLSAQGHERIRVTRWLADDPHPQAEVEVLPELVWQPGDETLLGQTERIVRRALAAASEFMETEWPANVELADEEVAAAWQLAGIAPLNPLDQLTLLKATTAHELLTRLAELVQAAAAPFVAAWSDQPE